MIVNTTFPGESSESNGLTLLNMLVFDPRVSSNLLWGAMLCWYGMPLWACLSGWKNYEAYSF